MYAYASRAILPARPLSKPSKITVKAVGVRKPTATGQDGQVHVHLGEADLDCDLPSGSIRRQSEGWPGPETWVSDPRGALPPVSTEGTGSTEVGMKCQTLRVASS